MTPTSLLDVVRVVWTGKSAPITLGGLNYNFHFGHFGPIRWLDLFKMTKVLDKFAKSRPLIGPILINCGVKIFHSTTSKTSNLTLNRIYEVTYQLMTSPKQRKSPRKVKPSAKEAENRKQNEDTFPPNPSAAGSIRKPVKSSSISF
jgi:hypothetical protein